MKTFIGIFLLSIIIHPAFSQKKIFVRVFDAQGVKIGTGHVVAVTDSSLQLENFDSSATKLMMKEIGTIRIRRSTGSKILIGSLIGAGSLAIVGAATGDPDPGFLGYSPGDGAAIGALTGALLGGAVGGIVGASKSRKFDIDGSAKKWRNFRLYVTE